MFAINVLNKFYPRKSFIKNGIFDKKLLKI